MLRLQCTLDRALTHFELSAQRSHCRTVCPHCADSFLLFSREFGHIVLGDLHSIASENIPNRVATHLVPDGKLVCRGAASAFADHRLHNIGGQLVAGWCRISQPWRSRIASSCDQELFQFSCPSRLFAIVPQQPDQKAPDFQRSPRLSSFSKRLGHHLA